MQLSIIIVNFNIKHFLEQCLCSVKTALANLEVEIIVVDNDSSDGSLAYLESRFPWVTFIANKTNSGFAKANNQVLKQATGDYVLFLNPDTLLPTDCLEKCLRFFELHKDAAALGVRMIDGSGNFLRESKRAFPAPLTSLFKLLGLSAIFPASKIFGRYHLGNLSEMDNHEVDVLAGAFMMIKRTVLDEVGYFDESFFMYGEDIDLSYRIQQAGGKNYYVAETSIIHFKGESTKKGSLNYVRIFYQAMNLFVQKHYGSGKAGFFRIFIQLAIWLRAGVSAFTRFIKWVGLPVVDILITLGSISLVARFWETVVKPGIVYDRQILLGIIPLFTCLFIIAGGVAGLYDKWYRPLRAWMAMMGAVIFNLAIYSLLNIDLRFSRGVILFGGVLASLMIILCRNLLVKNNLISSEDERQEIRQTLIAGTAENEEAVQNLMHKAGRKERLLGRVGIHENEPGSAGNFYQPDLLLTNVPAKEIIFCIDDRLTLAMAMAFMQQEKRKIRYKFYYRGSSSIIGSDSKETSGESLSASEYFSIESPESRRMKRISDIGWSLFLLVFFPVHCFFINRPLQLLKNLLQVLTGKKTWVGYCTGGGTLPSMPPAIVGSNAVPVKEQATNQPGLHTIDYWYAKDYEWMNDSRLIVKAYRHLGS